MNDSNAPVESRPASAKRSRLILLSGLFFIVLIIGVSVFAYEHLYGRFYEATEDAYVDGNRVQIGSGINGTVIRINADDGDYVEQGQVLVELDPSDTAIALAAAQADLAATVREVRGLFSSVANHRAQLATRQLERQQAYSDFNRRDKLAAAGVLSQEAMSHSRDALGQTENALIIARQQLSRSQALVEGTSLETHPQVQAARAKLHQAYINHARTHLLAPVSGYVAQRRVQPGARVAAGQALMAVIPLHQVWIEANFKETQMRQMQIGQAVDITADLYGSDVHYQGHIESLGVGTGGAFALLPAQNASGNWIKIVQRVPVRIGLQPEALQTHPLRLGMSTRVEVDLHQQDGDVLARRADPTARYTTDIYDNLLQEADQLATQLIQANSTASIEHSSAVSQIQ
ncbi:HlyD family efflux transporter periplasmic adaptor subunit [Amphritea sp. 1_MG-2023]|uniref:HlyD family efflux transporter periplasmic adaptor subunit n=1 Tax=Amphritea sp. 1_MG-2023 TaxID=3062670 RepID=UPI0026E2A1DF|nr:HlyD family efflux transporter periplasmic adaptor subunit [Amphritea sp. 1_MG-2023]MDO6563666.1 HlyD family efflux transporter periplasmic adaptor subunit [Amphritea sp. 1_MG-2023]